MKSHKFQFELRNIFIMAKTKKVKFKPFKIPPDTSISLTIPQVTIVNQERGFDLMVRVTKKGLCLDYERTMPATGLYLDADTGCIARESISG